MEEVGLACGRAARGLIAVVIVIVIVRLISSNSNSSIHNTTNRNTIINDNSNASNHGLLRREVGIFEAGDSMRQDKKPHGSG